MGNIDVEIETVFAAEGRVVTIPFAEFRLRVVCAVCIGATNAGPVISCYGRTTAEIAQRWLRRMESQGIVRPRLHGECREAARRLLR